MSIKATMICDRCGSFLGGEIGGFAEVHDLLARARNLGWERMSKDFEHKELCLCPKCLGKKSGEKAAKPASGPMATTYVFEFAVGQEVEVKALAAQGFVDGVSRDSTRSRYTVVYWLNGKRERECLYAHEIAAANGKAVEK